MVGFIECIDIYLWIPRPGFLILRVYLYDVGSRYIGVSLGELAWGSLKNGTPHPLCIGN